MPSLSWVHACDTISVLSHLTRNIEVQKREKMLPIFHINQAKYVILDPQKQVNSLILCYVSHLLMHMQTNAKIYFILFPFYIKVANCIGHAVQNLAFHSFILNKVPWRWFLSNTQRTSSLSLPNTVSHCKGAPYFTGPFLVDIWVISNLLLLQTML